MSECSVQCVSGSDGVQGDSALHHLDAEQLVLSVVHHINVSRVFFPTVDWLEASRLFDKPWHQVAAAQCHHTLLSAETVLPARDSRDLQVHSASQLLRSSLWDSAAGIPCGASLEDGQLQHALSSCQSTVLRTGFGVELRWA